MSLDGIVCQASEPAKIVLLVLWEVHAEPFTLFFSVHNYLFCFFAIYIYIHLKILLLRR